MKVPPSTVPGYVACSAAGNRQINIVGNHDYVTRARYLLLSTKYISETAAAERGVGPAVSLYHSVLHLCAEFCDLKPFLWLDIKKVTTAKVPV